jgi:hypothetical protein
MLCFYADHFIFLAKDLGRLVQLLESFNADDIRSGDTIKNDIEQLETIKGRFQSLGLRMCVAQVDRMIGE